MGNEWTKTAVARKKIDRAIYTFNPGELFTIADVKKVLEKRKMVMNSNTVNIIVGVLEKRGFTRINKRKWQRPEEKRSAAPALPDELSMVQVGESMVAFINELKNQLCNSKHAGR